MIHFNGYSIIGNESKIKVIYPKKILSTHIEKNKKLLLLVQFEHITNVDTILKYLSFYKCVVSDDNMKVVSAKTTLKLKILKRIQFTVNLIALEFSQFIPNCKDILNK